MSDLVHVFGGHFGWRGITTVRQATDLHHLAQVISVLDMWQKLCSVASFGFKYLALFKLHLL